MTMRHEIWVEGSGGAGEPAFSGYTQWLVQTLGTSNN